MTSWRRRSRTGGRTWCPPGPGTLMADRPVSERGPSHLRWQGAAALPAWSAAWGLVAGVLYFQLVAVDATLRGKSGIMNAVLVLMARGRLLIVVGAAVSCEAAVLERITIRVADQFRGSGIAPKIPLAQRIAPRSFWIPVPGLHKQLGVLAVTHHSPSSLENLLHLVGREEHVRRIAGNAIHSGSQCVRWTESVYKVAGCHIDSDRLS